MGDAAAYIGRVGGLAVALGVGAAVVTGQAVAFAEPDSNSPNPDSSQGPAADPASDGKGTTDSPVAKSPASDPPSGTATTTAGSKTPAEPGQAVSSGGALTSKKATDDGDKAGAAKAEEEQPDDTGDPDDIEAEPDSDPPPAQTSKRTKSDDVPVGKRPTNRPVTKPAATARDRPTAPAPTARSVVSSIAKAVDITPASGVPAQRTSLTEPTTFQTQSSLTTAQDTAPGITAAPSAPAAESVATTLLSAFGIGPSPANIPGAPAMPVVPALLAYAASREVEQSFAAKSASTSSTPVAAKALTGAPTAAVAAAPDRRNHLDSEAGSRER